MEQSLIKPTRLRRSKESISSILAEYEQSTTTVQEFCNLHNVSKATFYKWQSRYNKKNKKTGKPGGFALLKVVSPPAAACHAFLFAEVNGIKIYQPVEAAYLKQLLPPQQRSQV